MADATVMLDFKRFCCGKCGGTSFFSQDYHDRCLKEGGGWHCSYCGTRWTYKGTESEEAKAARIQAARNQRAADALTRLRDGICPCCGKIMKDVLTHLERRHPDWRP